MPSSLEEHFLHFLHLLYLLGLLLGFFGIATWFIPETSEQVQWPRKRRRKKVWRSVQRCVCLSVCLSVSGFVRVCMCVRVRVCSCASELGIIFEIHESCFRLRFPDGRHVACGVLAFLTDAAFTSHGSPQSWISRQVKLETERVTK